MDPVAILLGFLLGCIPTGLIISKLHGFDIRKFESGNIGAANIYRALGIKAALFVLFADAFKAFLPTVLWGLPAGIAAVIGNCFNPFLGFKGGKGAAHFAGVLTALAFKGSSEFLLIGAGNFFLVLLLTGISSLANLVATFNIALLSLSSGNHGLLIPVAALWLRHSSNIKRLLKRRERVLFSF